MTCIEEEDTVLVVYKGHYHRDNSMVIGWLFEWGGARYLSTTSAASKTYLHKGTLLVVDG